jgi:hypothetical protein
MFDSAFPAHIPLDFRRLSFSLPIFNPGTVFALFPNQLTISGLPPDRKPGDDGHHRPPDEPAFRVCSAPVKK